LSCPQNSAKVGRPQKIPVVWHAMKICQILHSILESWVLFLIINNSFAFLLYLYACTLIVLNELFACVNFELCILFPFIQILQFRGII
jgi:hypothetical protein